MKDQGGRTREVHIEQKPVRRPPERLPWPRMAEDGVTPLGVNVEEKRQDIVRIVYKHFRVPDVSYDELLQEVFLAIIHKNHGNSAHNPKKSSFGHYVYMIANNVCINLVHRKKRSELEKESLDAPSGREGRKSVLDTVAAPSDDEESNDALEDRFDDMEAELRRQGQWEAARYVRAVRTGASSAVIREALTWKGHRTTTKSIRDLRAVVKEAVETFDEA